MNKIGKYGVTKGPLSALDELVEMTVGKVGFIG
jgi:hypothetical protein